MMETIMTIIAGLGGITGLASLFYIKQERKSKDLDNESKDMDIEHRQSDEWRRLYEEERAMLLKCREAFDSELKEKDAKIDSLYSEISNQRNQKVELHNKIAEMTVEITKLRLLKCEMAACLNRKPPTGY